MIAEQQKFVSLKDLKPGMRVGPVSRVKSVNLTSGEVLVGHINNMSCTHVWRAVDGLYVIGE